MRNVGSLEHDGFRGKLVQIGRVDFDASVTRKRIRSLLVREKNNQVWLPSHSHRLRFVAPASRLSRKATMVASFFQSFSTFLRRQKVTILSRFCAQQESRLIKLNRE